MAITLRQDKGAPLTWEELDANFTTVAALAGAATTAETNAAASASAASLSATAASDSAVASAGSASAADASADAAAASALAASGSAATASGHATNAENEADAAAASALAAAGSATASSNSANTASSAATSATNSANAASTSASNASNSADSANTSAINAAASKTAAETAETNAEAAQAAAESARDSALSAWDSFDDRYLGSKASNPAVDNDGNALIDGALYWNTTANEMRVYDLGTTSWKATYVADDGYLQKVGGTMTGPLYLSDAPVTTLQAATKKYVDDGLATKASSSHTHSLFNITDRNVTEGTTSQDPNSASYPYILTAHANSPTGDGTYWYITSTYYSTSGNISQIAVEYTGNRTYTRSKYSGTWTSWARGDLGEGATRSLGFNGYLKLPGGGGIMLQWGTFNHPPSGNTQVIFPTAFSTTCANVVLTTVYNGGANNPSVNTVTNTGFYCNFSGSLSVDIMYQAIGW
jgi:hypothetical protein